MFLLNINALKRVLPTGRCPAPPLPSVRTAKSPSTLCNGPIRPSFAQAHRSVAGLWRKGGVAEWIDKPGSVVGNHASGRLVTEALLRPTRGPCGPHAAAVRRPAPLFGLAPSGVCPATAVASRAVRSYRTFSPLPPPEGTSPTGRRRYVFCGTFRRLASPRRYLALWSVEPGLSSPAEARAIAWSTRYSTCTIT
jgi:hypothetical protein